MSGHYIRKRTRLGGWAFGLASFAAMLLAVCLVFFRMEILDLQGLSLSVGTVALLVVLALILALVAVAKAWRLGHRGGGRALAGLALAGIVAVPFALGLTLAFEYPESTMAQTDGIEAADEFDGVLDQSGVLLGRDFQATAADVYSAARSTLDASGWEVVEVDASRLPQPAEGDLGVSGTVLVPVPTLRDTLGDEDQIGNVDPFAASDSDRYTITAIASTPILGLESDVTLRIAETDGTSYVDMRSASRDVPRDLGQNRRFIEGFLDRLDEAMTLLQSGPGTVED